ncbi:glutamine ABC transporter substrate-binding protein [Bacteroides sp. 214]|uniref:transporter substrate-binding domain-containing protein n=1 Tax=Bacteroides sp. 214 TaxID=2302935 RepID=UPI0013D8888F|nr:glutamine ABC transporter substrate-binding protein [Bacteroides sp. 214]
MKLTKPRVIKYVCMGVVAVLIATLWRGKEKVVSTPRDYPAISKEGILRAVTEYNSISYFLNEDNTISGFNYELIKAFAHNQGLQLEIVPEMGFDNRTKALSNGVYDVIADGIPTTNQWKDSLLLTTPITLSRQVLVQRKPSPQADSTTTKFVKSQLDLAHKTLYVEKGSPSILRIHNIEHEIADTIHIEEVEKYGPEQLIAMVAHNNIDYAVVDEVIAKALIDSFPQLDIHTKISFTQFYSWGVNKESPALLDSLNVWLKAYTNSKEYRQMYRKYFKKDPLAY